MWGGGGEGGGGGVGGVGGAGWCSGEEPTYWLPFSEPLALVAPRHPDGSSMGPLSISGFIFLLL